MNTFPKKLTALAAGGLAVGTGIGIGQGLIAKTGIDIPLFGAAAARAGDVPQNARSSDELNTIRVVKSVSPAVVTIQDGAGGLGSGVIIDGKNGSS